MDLGPGYDWREGRAGWRAIVAQAAVSAGLIAAMLLVLSLHGPAPRDPDRGSPPAAVAAEVAALNHHNPAEALPPVRLVR